MKKNSVINFEAIKNTILKENLSPIVEKSSQEQCFNRLFSLAESSIDSVDCFFKPEQTKVSTLEHINKLSFITAPTVAVLLSQRSAFASFVGVLIATAIPFVICHFVSKKVLNSTKSEPEITLNTETLQENLAINFKEIINLIEKEKRAAKEKNENTEFCNNKELIHWIQTFSLFVINSENNDLLQLLYSLEYHLEDLGIYIYYKLNTNADGSVTLPNPNYFIDDRSTDEWTKVVLPAVYTKDKLLALGRIV